MKTIINAFVLLLFFFITQTICGQENLQPGKIITLNGDTIQGYIDYNWNRNPIDISFKTALGDIAVSYNPKSILGFRVANLSYESAMVQLDKNNYDDQHLTESKSFELTNETIFLETLAEGGKSLYRFIDDFNKEHFFINQGKNFELLIYQRYYKKVQGGKKVVENKRFLGQLMVYFDNNPSIRTQISSVNYNTKDLRKLFSSYSKSTNTSLEFKNRKRRILTEFGITAGMSNSKLTFDGEEYPNQTDPYQPNYNYLIKANFSTSTNLIAGLFFNINIGAKNPKWALCNELLFTSSKFNGKYENYTSENLYTKYNTTYNPSHLKMNLLIRYRTTINKSHLFFKAGLSRLHLINYTSSLIIDDKFFTIEKITTTQPLDPSIRSSYFFGIGGEFKKYSIEFRYEKGGSIRRNLDLNSSTTHYSIFLGYRLK